MDKYERARAALAEQAARGDSPQQLLPRLRALTTAELLEPRPAPARAVELNAELDSLCRALTQAVRRRPGWLYLAPAPCPLPAAVRGRLLQAAVLCFVQGVLRTAEQRAVIVCRGTPGAALLTLRGGEPGPEALELLQALAAECGGRFFRTDRSPFAAVLRLPLAPDLPLREPVRPGDLLADRYSLPYLYLGGDCAGPET